MAYKPRERRTEGVPTRRKDVHDEIAKPKRNRAVDETYSRNKIGIAVDGYGRFIGHRDVEKGAAHFWNSRRDKNT